MQQRLTGLSYAHSLPFHLKGWHRNGRLVLRPTDLQSAGLGGERAKDSRACEIDLSKKPVLGPVSGRLEDRKDGLRNQLKQHKGRQGCLGCGKYSSISMRAN